MWSHDHIQLFAPAPPEVRGSAQVFGTPGVRTFSYWVVTHYPIGISVSGPFTVFHVPDQFDAANYVLISWEPAISALKYDLIRSDSRQFPQNAGPYALALDLTETTYRDQGQALQSFAPAGLPYGAPAQCTIQLNNRDYTTPTMEMPSSLKVSTLIFTDGSMQWSAGGGGSGPILVAGSGIQFVSVPGPPPSITISAPAVFAWTQDVNANGYSLNGAASLNATSVNAGSVAVAGNINITGEYRINGVPLNVQGEAYVGSTPPASPNEGRLWFDDSILKLFIRYSGAWIGLN